MNPHDVFAAAPRLTADLADVGGCIKARDEHFVVEEIPAYEPCGAGDHVFVMLTRSGIATGALVKRLADLFGLRDADVGFAGRKDKHAVTTQTFSIKLPNDDAEEVARRIDEALDVTIDAVSRHRNKLRAGHLRGNRFRITVTGAHDEALARARAKVERLRTRPIPNLFGEQRFGGDGDNVRRGLALLRGEAGAPKWQRRFLVSAVQSWIFNGWLAERCARGLFDELLDGDVVKKTDTGGLFVVEDVATDRGRFDAGAIDYTGPIFGPRMRAATGQAGALEAEVLARTGIELEQLGRSGGDGTRRPARLLVPDLDVVDGEEGPVFTFSLPKGSYATTVLAETGVTS